MSDIRFNQWLHQSGTGGVSQVDGGHVGIGTTNPDIAVHSANAKKLNVGIVTANSIYAGNYYGNGSNLTGIGDADKIIEGDTKVEVFDAGSQYISAEVNGTERLRIDSSGRVLIGTTVEGYDTGDNLTIASNGHTGITIRSGTSAGGNLFFSDGTSGADEYRGNVSYDHTNNFMRFYVNAAERLRIDSSGGVHIATTSGNEKLNVHGAIRASGSSANFNAGLEGALVDYDTLNNIARFGHVNGASGSARSVTFISGGTERLRIASNGRINIGSRTTTPDELVHIHTSSGEANVHVEAATNAILKLRAHSGDSTIQFSDASASGVGKINYDHGTDSLAFSVQSSEAVRIDNNGRMGIGYSTPRRPLEVNSTHDSTADTITPVLRLSTGTGYSGSNTGSGLEFGTTNTSYPTWIKGRIGAVYNGSSNYGGHLVFETNSGSAAESSNSEKMRISDKGLITNTTQSTHPQGAGTFEIKGVINQYSQGSGSGLIFDCDFGRLTGYGDDTNVGNGTNLSACLAHSTTDWSSSNSNTPISVNGGTFQYRVSFGGYMEGINNGGRVSVAAGSGNPAMSDKLNTASMTIETWCWYSNGGREVLVSRWGSGFPNQFNMICDPDGQFHYNSGGVGAGSGNLSGEHFPAKTWHHHVWQYDSGSNVNRWYINGAFANSRSHGSSLAVNSQTGFGIFSRGDDYERFRGKIAIVRIYNRALSAVEIKNHFELERGRFGV